MGTFSKKQEPSVKNTDAVESVTVCRDRVTVRVVTAAKSGIKNLAPDVVAVVFATKGGVELEPSFVTPDWDVELRNLVAGWAE